MDNTYGYWPGPVVAAGEIDGMASPVRCSHCGDIYDLAAVHVTARYADCSLWNTPCCGRQVDDRRGAGIRHYEYIRQEGNNI